MYKVYKITGTLEVPVYTDLFQGPLLDCQVWIKENITTYSLFIVAV